MSQHSVDTHNSVGVDTSVNTSVNTNNSVGVNTSVKLPVIVSYWDFSAVNLQQPPIHLHHHLS